MTLEPQPPGIRAGRSGEQEPAGTQGRRRKKARPLGRAKKARRETRMPAGPSEYSLESVSRSVTALGTPLGISFSFRVPDSLKYRPAGQTIPLRR